MKMVYKNLALSATASIGLVLLSGCSTINPYTGEKQMSNTTLGTGLGALGGAAVGALAGGGRGAIIGGTVGALAGSVAGNIMDRQDYELRQALTGTGVQVQKQGDNIQLIMASDVTFSTGQSEIREDFYPVLKSVATVLKKYDKTNVIITGYTDNVGNAAYNQTLSEQRASSVGNFLISQDINTNRVFTQGQGKRNPIASNATANGRALNRRVVITLRPIA